MLIQNGVDLENDRTLQLARSCLIEEADALHKVANQLNGEFCKAVDMILACEGKVVVCGMGKSGIIGKKVSATLASTGTPSFFLHPGEAYHGDLGMIEKEDIVILISYSGETQETVQLIRPLKRFGNRLISIVGNEDSTLARAADTALIVKVDKEACPFNLAPTTSTTATLALGDALAVTLMQKRSFKPENFAMFHPGGSLGRRLLSAVKDVMLREELPLITPEAGLEDIISVLSRSKIGIAIVHEERNLRGVITDSDLRKGFSNFDNPLAIKARDIMSKNPLTTRSFAMAYDAQKQIKLTPCRALVVLDQEDKVVGLFGRDIYNQ